jgi:hypothetical protein
MMRLLRLSLVATAGLSIAAIAAPEHERLRGRSREDGERQLEVWVGNVETKSGGRQVLVPSPKPERTSRRRSTGTSTPSDAPRRRR